MGSETHVSLETLARGAAVEVELWREVVGHPSYQVSNCGQIRRIARNRRGVLIPREGLDGYLRIQLTTDGHRPAFAVHVLVAAAFLGPRPDGLVIDHIDGNKYNNAAVNLEYVTQKENIRRSVAMGLHPTGDRNGSRLHPESYPRGDAHYARTNPERLARGERHGSRTKPECLPRGEAHPGARLNDSSIRTIRRLRHEGVSSRALAVDFGVSKVTINKIVKGSAWSHIG